MAKTKLSLKERMAKKREDLKKGGGSGKSGIIFIKEGTIRVRVLPTGEENDFVHEVTQFYLGPDIKGVYSPATFGEPCAVMEAFKELKASDDPDDKELAKKFVPKRKYLMPVVIFKDLKGKEVDPDNSGKLVQLTAGLYQDIIDLYLDEDEWGDMTDTKEGYDLKLSRTGSGMTDTEYTVQPCKNTKAPKAYIKEDFDLESTIRNVIPSYDETQEKVNQFLNITDDEEEEEAPRKKKKKSGKKKKKKKKSDI
jgi:hypothetical protein